VPSTIGIFYDAGMSCCGALQEQGKLQALAKELAERQNSMEEQETLLLQRQAALEAQAVAAEEHDDFVRELSMQAEQKLEALSAREKRLNRFEEALKSRESRLAEHYQRLDAQIQKEEKEQVRFVYACECSATKFFLAACNPLLYEHIERVQQLAQAASADAAEASRLKEAKLQEELRSLKDMYARQFVAWKQELDAAQQHIQQLRRQNIRPHNGVKPQSDGGPEVDSTRGPTDLPSGGAVPDSEFAAWASELITKVSRSPTGGLFSGCCTAPCFIHCSLAIAAQSSCAFTVWTVHTCGCPCSAT
jgi:hypothetical protein